MGKSNEKYREFWLTNVDDEYDASVYCKNPNFDWAIHVIEKSAYDERNELLKSRVENVYSYSMMERVKDKEKYDALLAQNKLLVEVLELAVEYLEPRFADKFGSRGREFILPKLRQALSKVKGEG